MQDIRDLGLMLDRQLPLLVIETYEESRTLEILTRLAIQRGLGLQQWTLTDGLRRLGFGEDLSANDDTHEPDAALAAIKSREQGGLFVLCDLHPYLHEAKVVRLLKDIALQHKRFGKTLVLLSHQLKLPDELKRMAAYFSLHLPDEEQLLALVREEARLYAKQHGRKVKADHDILHRLVANLRGLTLSDARHLIRGAIVDDGALSEEDVPAINKAKLELMDMDGVLQYEFDTARFAEVAGLNQLKQWLEQRHKAFLEADDALRPKGMMLFGIQGGGKSLAAKAVAGSWGVPLLRLDFGTLFNKFIGETERQLRESLQLAEAMSPSVVWIDEIEKGLGQDATDGGVSQRVLGTLLTWLAEHKARVFVVATANNIHALPPELVRKGRLDELFFVDLPDAEVRQKILAIHLQKRGLDSSLFDLAAVSAMSEGFSGAELEQAVVSAWHASDGERISTDSLMREIMRTRPLSVTMAEPLQRLRQWAQERAVMAS
ncbi:ATPase [Bacterioplanes sanyensis]|uniref:Uncharacterized AAA domain-containing protein ycf46 n=1 Tax=Bacterioplanes sanyensis TaxID=1249553 RepID=A0A222FIS3_9GAMM|nr:AAA family ATPase [Bacterioplanes sanyensis]ASP38935.1 ATPase [Bacterioplanes sanyensis]